MDAGAIIVRPSDRCATLCRPSRWPRRTTPRPLPTAAADVCIFDPNETWLYDTSSAFSKSFNSPWNHQQLTGRVKTTIVAGKVVFDGQKIVA